jgi:hypothetical protein
VINAGYSRNSPYFNDQGTVSDFRHWSTHIRYIIIPNVADFPMVSVGSVILKKWPDTQEYVVTTLFLPGMQRKEISCLIILRCWHSFELIIVSK